MPNYNDNNTRDNSIDQLPRMIFQLPNTDSGTALPSANPVFFCQSGCAIDYHFSNINSCQFNNDGKKFTITPTDTTNYIMWNGTDINSGEKMVQFTLKEVFFTAPAKDYIGTNSDILSQSIQYYFVFVNEKYSNLMICVSVIGSVNNIGNAPKSNGFVMMETLSTRIPSINVQSDLSNLNNFNLGTLIPPNKPFFSTLITNNIQYIILTEVVDIPINFFTNIATIVNGGTQLYTAKMNQFKTNIPQNPPTTILFYNENSQLLDNQNIVCNSNCDLVPAKKITPSIGTYTSTETEKEKIKNEQIKTISGAELPPEKCEMEEVWANQPTDPKLPNKSNGSTQHLSDGEGKDSTTVVALTISFLILLVFITFIGFLKYTNKNKLSILFLVIGLISIIVGLSVGCSLYTKKPNTYWISYVIGILLWLISLIFIRKFKNYDSYEYSSFNSTTYLPNKQPSITVPSGFNEPTSWFSKIFSSNDTKPTHIYSPQLSIPTSSNTQPKKSLFDIMFKKNQDASTVSVPSITVPQSSSSSIKTASVPSITVPQSSQPKQSFLSKLNPFSKTSTPIKISQNIINKTSNLINHINRNPILSAENKKKLINKLNINSPNIIQQLNNAHKYLNKFKSTQ